MKARAVVSVGVNPYNNPQGLLPMKHGEEITIISRSGTNRCIAKNSRGHYGIVLKSYYKPTNDISTLKLTKKQPEIEYSSNKPLVSFEDDYINDENIDLNTFIHIESQKEGAIINQNKNENEEKQTELIDYNTNNNNNNSNNINNSGITIMGLEQSSTNLTTFSRQISEGVIKSNNSPMTLMGFENNITKGNNSINNNNNNNNNSIINNDIKAPNIPSHWITPINNNNKNDIIKNNSNNNINNSNNNILDCKGITLMGFNNDLNKSVKT